VPSTRVEPGDVTAVRRPQRVVAPALIGSLAALSQARAYTSPIRYTPSR
jgi:hypothetical protein